MEYITPQQWMVDNIETVPLQPKPVGNQGGRKKTKYKDLICAFDIETSRIASINQSIVYMWQLQLGLDTTIIGRNWREFTDLMKKISNRLNDDEYLVLFVHNLSYEFQFLRGIYDFQPHEVFALKSRKVLKCTMFDHIELRCSYIHANLGLDAFTKKFNVVNRKLDGAVFDYKKMRYPWTELTDYELEYGINDVKGLVQAITTEMAHDGDSLYTYPLTNTGYVRRDIKLAMREVSHHFVKDQLPSLQIYQKCREAFRGGNTHANRYYVDRILEGVKSADRVSSYPDVIANCDFPISRFMDVGAMSCDQVKDLIYERKHAVLMRVAFTNIDLLNPYFGSPYIPKDKCRNVRGAVIDNGRILKADYLEMTITDIDFKIILGEYKWVDSAFFDVSHARYGKLPAPLIGQVNKYFKDKTELKNVQGMELFYDKSKNKINAIYGMMAQDPVKATFMYIDGEFTEDEMDMFETLMASNKRAFLCYQWGVWTTAWARFRLEEGIMLAGEGFVYTDTDSVKYMGDIDWDSYNKLRIEDSKKNGAYATDIKGNTHYMGVFEMENDGKCYDKFVTLGAKKYAYEMNGKLTITLAGVSKKLGAKELTDMGGIEFFRENTLFIEAGGTQAVYNDNPPMREYEVDGRVIEITSNMCILDSTYRLGLGEEYKRVLEMSKQELENILNKC